MGPPNATFDYDGQTLGLRCDARALKAAEVRNGQAVVNTLASGDLYSYKMWVILEEFLRSAGHEGFDEDQLMVMVTDAQEAVEKAVYEGLDLGRQEKKATAARKKSRGRRSSASAKS